MRSILVLILLTIGLTGCASHKTSQYSINGEEVFLGWNNQKNLPSTDG